MVPKLKTDVPKEAFDWYDDYAHGGMDRRTFMAKLATLTALGYSMTALTSALMPNYAFAEQVSFNDSDITARYEEFESPDGYGLCGGYLVEPREHSGNLMAVLVVHENRGLNPYVEDVARRLAKSGYLAFAPDALFPLGGYPGNDDEGKAMQRSMDKPKLQNDFVAAANYLKNHPDSNGKLGAVGFCFGGYIVNYLAAIDSNLINAGVPFYGTPADPELRENIKAPLLVQLAELDERVNKTWPDYEKDLKRLNVPHQMHMYESAKHGFHNDSTARYDETNAELAWERTLNFFAQELS